MPEINEELNTTQDPEVPNEPETLKDPEITKGPEETDAAKGPEVTTEPKPEPRKKQKRVSFSHRFLFATYDFGFARVDFVNGSYTTDRPEIIEVLRKHPDFGQEMAEVK